MRKLHLLAWLSLLIGSNFLDLAGYPTRFMRLIKEENGKLIKTVDLIFDVHIPITHSVKKASPGGGKKFLSMEERERFTASERTLLIALRKLAAQKSKEPPIKLLWELWQGGKGDRDVFIFEAGNKLHEEFKPENQKNIQFIPSDTYRSPRNFLPDVLSPEEALASFKMLGVSPTVRDTFTFVINLVNGTNPAVAHDFEQITDPQMKDALKKVWDDYKKNQLNPFHRRFIVGTGEESSVIDLLQSIPAVAMIRQLFANVITNTMDYELLFKIFGSGDHFIVYAGAAHCRHLAQMLIDDYQFKVMTDYGAEAEELMHNLPVVYVPILQANIWEYLLESPQKSWEIYKKKGTRAQLLSEEEVIAFLDAGIKGNLATVKKMVKKGDAAHVDLINTLIVSHEDRPDTTLLAHFIEKEYQSLIDFFLAHGAYANIGNGMPLLLAAEKNNKALVEKLLAQGADPSKTSGKGLTAAQITTDLELQKMLVAAEKKHWQKNHKKIGQFFDEQAKKPFTSRSFWKKSEKGIARFIATRPLEPTIESVEQALALLKYNQLITVALGISLQKLNRINDFIAIEHPIYKVKTEEFKNTVFEQLNKLNAPLLHHVGLWATTYFQDAIAQTFGTMENFLPEKQDYLHDQSWQEVLNSAKKINQYLTVKNPESAGKPTELLLMLIFRFRRLLAQHDDIFFDVAAHLALPFNYFFALPEKDFNKVYSPEIFNDMKLFDKQFEKLADLIDANLVKPLLTAYKKQKNSPLIGARSAARKIKLLNNNMFIILLTKLFEFLVPDFPLPALQKLVIVIDQLSVKE